MGEIEVRVCGRSVPLNSITEKLIAWIVQHQDLFALRNFHGAVVPEAHLDTETGSLKPKAWIRPEMN